MGFDPLSLMIIGTGLSGAASVAGGIGANSVAKGNAANMEAQADQVDGQTVANASAQKRNFDKFRGSLRADLAAYGGSAKRGTGLLMAQEAERQGKLDELNILTEGTNNARSLRAGAGMVRAEGKNAMFQGVMGGLGSAMQGYGAYKGMRG